MRIYTTDVKDYYYFPLGVTLIRSVMDVNGENMVKRWPRVTLVHAPTIGAPWPLDAQFASRYSYTKNISVWCDLEIESDVI